MKKLGLVLVLVTAALGCGGNDSQAAVDLASAADLAVAPDLASVPGYGARCSTQMPCGSDLFCLKAPNGLGFCTQVCAAGQSAQCPGTPAGMAAFCVVTDVTPSGDKGCAFVCTAGGKTFTCPSGLTCQANEDPVGSGQRLCMPE